MNFQGILHATSNISGQTFHVGYANGLICIATDASWENAKKAFHTPKSPVQSPLASEKLAIASQIKVADLTTILGIRYAIIKEQIGNFLSPFDRFEIQSNFDEERFTLSANGVKK